MGNVGYVGEGWQWKASGAVGGGPCRGRRVGAGVCTVSKFLSGDERGRTGEGLSRPPSVWSGVWGAGCKVCSRKARAGVTVRRMRLGISVCRALRSKEVQAKPGGASLLHMLHVFAGPVVVQQQRAAQGAAGASQVVLQGQEGGGGGGAGGGS